jgi:hypothetical protein
MVLLLHPRPAPVASLAELATGSGRRPGRHRRRRAQGWLELVDRGLDRVLRLPPEPLWPVQRPRSFSTWWLVFDLVPR